MKQLLIKNVKQAKKLFIKVFILNLLILGFTFLKINQTTKLLSLQMIPIIFILTFYLILISKVKYKW